MKLTSTPQLDLNKEFTTTTFLLRLLNFLNHNGADSKFLADTGKPVGGLDKSSLESDALATILVMDQEDLATCYASQHIVLVKQSDRDVHKDVSRQNSNQTLFKGPLQNFPPLDSKAAIGNPRVTLQVPQVAQAALGDGSSRIQVANDPKAALGDVHTRIQVANDAMASLGRMYSPPNVAHDAMATTGSSHPLSAVATSQDSPKLRVLDVDKVPGFWGAVKLDKWRCAFETVSLVEHTKTLIDYLDCYRTSTAQQRQDYSSCFSAYLLTTCWNKMYSQVTTWRAVGHIYGLHHIISSGSLKQAVNHFAWESFPCENGRGDGVLLTTLRMHTDGVLPYVMENLPEMYRSIETLLEVSRVNNPGNAYSKNTAIEFHCLLVGVLSGFAQGLSTLKDSAISDQNKFKIFGRLSVICQILTDILNSASFTAHSTFLLNSGILKTIDPKLENYSTYKEFANQHLLDINPTTSEGAVTNDDLSSSIRALIAHFLARKTLEESAAGQSGNVIISLFTVNPPSSPNISRFEVEETIVNTLTLGGRSRLDPQRAIQSLEKLVKGPTSKKTDDVIRTFKAIISNEGGIHLDAGFYTEIVLASLGLKDCRDIIFKDSNVGRLRCCQNMDKEMGLISVSQSSSPACSVFFQVLQDTAPNLKTWIRGSHSDISAVQLPPWLPPKIVEKMIERFQRDLRSQLESFVA